jgi:hypothetical protein
MPSYYNLGVVPDMKRTLLSALLLCSFCLPSVAQNVTPDALAAQETFIMASFSQAGAGTALVREYALGSAGDSQDAEAQAALLVALVSENTLLPQRFDMDDYQIIYEKLTKAEGHVTGEYVFGKRTRNKRKFLAELYESLLGTRVKVSINRNDIVLEYTSTTLRPLQHNGRGISQRGANDYRVVWPAEQVALELLVAPVNPVPEQAYQTLAAHITTSVSGPSQLNESGTSDALQHDFDIARLKDLAVLSGYIEQFHALTGRYPLQGASTLANYSFIATREQQKGITPPPYEHTRTEVGTLISELQQVLGEDLELPFDPQQFAVTAPVFYMYMIIEDTWFLAVHLYGDYPFANRLGDHYSKVEITNRGQTGPGQWLREALMNNADYQAAVARQPHQPGYVEKVRAGMGGNRAF